MNTLRLLDRPIAFHRCLVSVTGSVTGALLLSQAIYWQNRCPNDEKHKGGWWWKTQEEWENETGMTRRELETARSSCKAVLEHKVAGIPCTSWYKVNEEALQTCLAESAKLDCTKAPNKDGVKRQTICTETPSETPSETSLLFAALEEKEKTNENSDHTKYTPNFETFWEAYPRKVSKADAFKAWMNITDRPSLETILTAVNWQKATVNWQTNGGSYVPYPATWLNKKRWEDERQSESCPVRGHIAHPRGRL